MHRSRTETELIAASKRIGKIAKSNDWFVLYLAERIDKLGVSVEEMTIGDLLRLDSQMDHDYNESIERAARMTV